ncbi:related to GTPase activating protein [Sporisorium reilianum f. sp. reilianum]|uniref:Related to GTPase activating protein n=1 Tax=Sporisorium reilianum f. sp. reilianum TaxID=72559 RepID=A0A2N8UJZ5_9BASI|nr:related to GTPase activating protein [Sporisorium reilianum f. sp. reilianum]
MRRNTAVAFDPASPPLASRRDASFARLRSGSASTYTSPRTTAAGDAEVSLGVLIWCPSTSKSSSSTLARAPLFRDAVHVKQKLSMRSSSSHGNRTTDPNHEPIFERASFGFRHGGSSWLREKPSKARLNSPSSSVGLLGQWKRACLLVRENGGVSIFGDANALTHSFYCGALSSSDVRRVDDSLFGRAHVLSIQPRQARVKADVSITTRKQEAALQQERARSSDPIFLEFKSEQQLQYVRTLLLIYIKPEIYGSPATVNSGGTHRFFRQLDITISDAKNIMPRWPTELGDSAPEFAASPPSPFSSHPLAHGHQPASPTSTSAGGTSTASSDLPRSLSHQLAALRSEDQDDSPGSELTEDTLSGSSRANSRPNSRLSSRLRHNAKPSVSSIRVHHDLDDNAGSSSSRSASRAASHHDNQSQAGDDASSLGEHTSGPLSGHSGAHRFVPIPTSSSETPSSIYPSAGAASSFKAPAQQRRLDDKDRYEKTRFDRYCRIRLDGELVARTSLSHSSNNAFAVDKFKLNDVGDAKSLVIEVLHPTLKTGSSLSGSPSQVTSKYMMLGIVEIPIETLRRNEDVEGRFPIWSISTFPALSQHPVDEDEARIPTGFHRGVVGELSLSIRLHEGAVMPLSMYDEVYRRIHDADAAEMVRHLSTTMREDLIISHLIRIYAASGTIAERISSLIEAESVSWGEKMEPELLFRANTLLSRSVDHFQRLLALSWLDDCLGPTVRKICHDPLAPSRPDTATSSSSAGSAGNDESHFDFSTSMRSPPSLLSNALDAIPDGPMTTNALRKLSENMWQNIYRQRHCCPPDLRTVLHQIRCKVNERYRSSKSTRPGIQGVGAFVFLRLFCAALNAPQLYGLTPSQPGRGAQRKLLLLSKVLLALASKKTAFDKDKDWELVPLNDLLRTYSSAYDDYISVVSTEPPAAAPVQLLGVRIDGDADLQAAALRRLGSLSPLHREAIPRAPHMLDQPQALASFVCFVADAAQEHEHALDIAWSETQHDDSVAGSSASESEDGGLQSEAARIKRKAHEFVQICCRIEDAAGMCIEQAGYDPRPIAWERLQRAAVSHLARRGGGTPPVPGSSPARGGQADASMASLPWSNGSPSKLVNDGDASPRSPAGRARSRRATVSAVNARSRMTDAVIVHDGLFESHSSNSDAASARSARRKSAGVGLSRSHAAIEPPASRLTYGDSAASRDTGATRAMTAQQRAVTAATASPYRPTFMRRRDEEEDNHGSDEELREAYRLLRAEEEAGLAASRIAMPSGLTTVEPTPIGEPLPVSPVRGGAAPSGLGLEPTGAPTLLEAEDGSTFEPVFAVRATASVESPPPPSAAAATTPRNYSLPRASVDRRNSLHRDMRESSDGFELAMEDAYAQTRASLPPSASMPVVSQRNEAGHATDSGVGAEKKKKWWKP